MAEMRTIGLKHRYFDAERMFFFYDGEVHVEDGVATVPVDRPEWITQLFIRGYKYDPKGFNQETAEPLDLDEVLTKCAAYVAKVENLAKARAKKASAS